MPFFLKCRDIESDLTQVHSAMIIPCRFCPAASFAVRENKEYIDLFRDFLATAAYESYIQELKSNLEDRGIRVEIFDNKLPHRFIMCMWPNSPRKELAKYAANYDAVIVMGCDAALEVVQESMGLNKCKIIRGMDTEGLMSVKPAFRFPCKITLELCNVTRVLEYAKESDVIS